MLPTIIVVVALYFLAMLGIGWYGRRYSKTFDGYLSMGRRGGIILMMGSCIGANIGNGFVVGGAGEGAMVGLAGSAYGLACACTALVSAVFLTDFIFKNNYSSLAEFTSKRYNSEVPGIIYVIATTFSSIGLWAGQLMAGRALFEAIGLNGVVGIFVIAIVVFAYSQLAGIWGAYATSVVQTVVIIAGLVLTAIVIFAKGGVDVIQDAVAAGTAPAGALNFSGLSAAGFLGMSLPVVLSMITDQNIYVRIGTAKSAKSAKMAHYLSFLVMIPLAIMPAFIGVYGASVYGATGDTAFFNVVMNELPGIVAAIVIAAILAAVMSTIDSGFSCVGSVIIRDFIQGTLKKDLSDKQLKLAAMIVNITMVVASLILALNAGTILDLLNQFYAFLAAACFVPFVGGILWKKGNATGAVAASVVGVLVVVLGWCGVPMPSLGGFFPCIPGAIAFIIGSLVKPNKAVAKAAK